MCIKKMDNCVENTNENDIETKTKKNTVSEEESQNSNQKSNEEGSSVNDQKNAKNNGPDTIPPKEFISPAPRDLNKVSLQSEHDENTYTKQFNTRALSRLEPTYKLETFKKNILVIFNQEDLGHARRYGTHKDVEALINIFEKFNFEIILHNDLTAPGILNEMEEFTSRDFTDYGCIGVVVLTHGANNGRLSAANNTYFIDALIIEKLQAKDKHTLVTKPKFLIIQACRGTVMNEPILVLETDFGEKDPEPEKVHLVSYYHLPEEADILILHSSYFDSPSFRDEIEGSWLIQTLCKTIDIMAIDHDLESIITEVKRVVSIDLFRSHRSRLHGSGMFVSQMPVLTSTLTRKLYLKKFGDPPPVIDSRLTSSLTFEEFTAPWFSTMDDIEPPTPLPYSYFAVFILYMLISLLCSGTLYIHIN